MLIAGRLGGQTPAHDASPDQNLGRSRVMSPAGKVLIYG
jgi:hypothetical protein